MDCLRANPRQKRANLRVCGGKIRKHPKIIWPTRAAAQMETIGGKKEREGDVKEQIEEDEESKLDTRNEIMHFQWCGYLMKFR